MSERIYFGSIKEGIEPPNLIEVQANSYVDFLQKDLPFSKRKNQGLQAVFKEVFPIESYDEKAVLDFSHYEIGEPKLDALWKHSGKDRRTARRCMSRSNCAKKKAQKKRKFIWAKSR